MVGVLLGVAVGVSDGVGVSVAEGVAVAVAVSVGVGVFVGVGVIVIGSFCNVNVTTTGGDHELVIPERAQAIIV